MTNVVEFRPNPGPQEDFLETSADIAFYGGAAGGGKSYAVLLDGLRWHADPNFGGIIFRRESVDLIGAGSIWEVSMGIYPLFGATSRQQPREHRFPSGATIEFAHLQHETDKLSHQGMQYAWIAFEELTHFTESQFWYLVSRRRTGANMNAYVRATCNPDPDSFVAKMVSWYIGDDGYAIPERSGVLRYFARDKESDALIWGNSRAEVHAAIGDPDPDRVMSFTFILSRLKDNPKVDRSYRAALLSLPLVERERLIGDEERGGNWKVRPTSGSMFRRAWFKVLEPGERVPYGRLVATVRGWDKAGTEQSAGNDPDWTVGTKVERWVSGEIDYYVVRDVVRLRATPGGVNQTIIDTALADGAHVTQCEWQDPGAAGVLDADIFTSMLARNGIRARIIKAARGKIEYASTWSPLVERGMVYVERAHWNDAYFAELEAFPLPRAKKDQVDSSSNAFIALGDEQPFEWTSGAAAISRGRERDDGDSRRSPVTGRLRLRGGGGMG